MLDSLQYSAAIENGNVTLNYDAEIKTYKNGVKFTTIYDLAAYKHAPWVCHLNNCFCLYYFYKLNFYHGFCARRSS